MINVKITYVVNVKINDAIQAFGSTHGNVERRCHASNATSYDGDRSSSSTHVVSGSRACALTCVRSIR